MKPTILLTVLMAALGFALLQPNPVEARRSGSDPQVLPEPSWENSFQLWIQRTDGRELADWTVEHREVVDSLGKGGIYLRLNYDCSRLPDDYRAEHGLYQSYAWNSPLDSCNPNYNTTDRRARQWDQDNQLVSDEDKKQHGNPADNDLSLSGYCKVVTEGSERYIKALAERYLREQKRRRLKIFAGPNEFGRIFYKSDERWWDYGPYTQTEFRDWLTHKGEFAEGGRYEGMGCPGNEHFSDDPSPNRAEGRGKSFNASYGTDFETWQLKYWDIEAFPGELPHNIKPMPGPEEEGFIEGGFDAPRAPGQPLWALWNCAREQAPGFLQWRIHQSLIEYVKIASDAGVPKEEIWTRQHGLFYNPKREGKARNIEMAPWMNVTPYSNMGFNKYGGGTGHLQHVREVAQLAEQNEVSWGSFEIHPSFRNAHKLNAGQYLQVLRAYHDNGAHLFRAACWGGHASKQASHGINHGEMAVKDTPFEEAIRTFLETTPDRPRGSDEDQEWLVPAPRNLEWDGEVLRWDPRMWEGHPFSFHDWGGFDYFEIHTAEEIDDKGRLKGSRRLEKVKRGDGFEVELKASKVKRYLLVLGVCEGRAEGPWSEPLETSP